MNSGDKYATDLCALKKTSFSKAAKQKSHIT